MLNLSTTFLIQRIIRPDINMHQSSRKLTIILSIFCDTWIF